MMYDDISCEESVMFVLLRLFMNSSRSRDVVQEKEVRCVVFTVSCWICVSPPDTFDFNMLTLSYTLLTGTINALPDGAIDFTTYALKPPFRSLLRHAGRDIVLFLPPTPGPYVMLQHGECLCSKECCCCIVA